MIGVSDAMVGTAAAAGLGVPLGSVMPAPDLEAIRGWCSGPVECKSGERKRGKKEHSCTHSCTAKNPVAFGK
jgi:hypothetical protein